MLLKMIAGALAINRPFLTALSEGVIFRTDGQMLMPQCFTKNEQAYDPLIQRLHETTGFPCFMSHSAIHGDIRVFPAQQSHTWRKYLSIL